MGGVGVMEIRGGRGLVIIFFLKQIFFNEKQKIYILFYFGDEGAEAGE